MYLYRPFPTAVTFLMLITLVAGCQAQELTAQAVATGSGSIAPAAGGQPVCERAATDLLLPDEECRAERRAEGLRLFDHETFGGNGRTCVTCHSVETGTLNPQQVRDRFARDRNDPLFRHDGLDDFASGTSRIRRDATILVEIPLPPNVSLVDDPEARSVVLARGIPSTLDIVASDKYFQMDLRVEGAEQQAAGAIDGHAQAGVAPTEQQLELLAEVQATDRRFFSSDELHAWANGLSLDEPGLPEPRTPQEARGREFFEDRPFAPPALEGFCALCHSGPLLNQPNAFLKAAVPFTSPLQVAHPAFVSQANRLGLPERTYAVEDACGEVRTVTSSDPGLMLTDPWTIPEMMLPPKESCLFHPAAFAGFFKTPSLRGIARTAPYFHDNSARTLRETVEQYNFMFDNDPNLAGQGLQLSDPDIDAIVAFMKLL